MNKQIVYGLLLIAGAQAAVAQVGVNTTDPKTTLHVEGTNDKGAVTGIDGVLVPRVNALATDGTEDGQLVFLIEDAGTFSKGFHYWNADAVTPANSAWVPIADAEAIAASAEVTRIGANNIVSSRAGVDTNGTSVGSGSRNILLGDKSGASMASGSGNVFLGESAGSGSNSPGDNNVYLGKSAGNLNRGNSGENIGIGWNALNNTRSSDGTGNAGYRTVALGRSAFAATGLNDENIGIGFFTGKDALIDERNTIIGSGAAELSTLTSDNIIMGTAAVNNGNVSSENIMIGRSNSLNIDTTGNQNTAVGPYQLRNASIGNSNASFGPNVFNAATLANNNIGIGNSAGQRLEAGTGNIVIGQTVANDQTILNNNIAIGNQIEFADTGATAAASNQLNIQNAIFGTGNAGTGTTVSALGKIGIGQPAPQERLDVAGIAKSDNIRTNIDLITSSSTAITKANSVIISDVNVSLPAPTDYNGITISITNSGASNITFNTGNQLVNGTTDNTRFIPESNTFKFTSNGTEWFITAQM